MDREGQDWSDCLGSSMPKGKRARLEAEPGLVMDVTQEHGGEVVVGQNIIDQLMKKEQEATYHILKSGKVENTVGKEKPDGDGEVEATSCNSQREEMDSSEGKVLDPGPTNLFKRDAGAGYSGIIDQQAQEAKASGEDVIVEDKVTLEAGTPGVKEDIISISPTVEGSEEIIIEEHVVKGEVVIDDDVEVVKDAGGDILQPIVILDGQSICRVAKFVYLTPEQKLSNAFDHFTKKGFKVVIFFPKSMVKKVKDASDEVKAALKLTVKKLPRTFENAWGMDMWEVRTFNIAEFLPVSYK